MKNIVVALILSLILLSCRQATAQEFTIEGRLSGVKEKVKKVYFQYKQSGNTIFDSAEVLDGRYILKGIIDETNTLLTDAVYYDTSLKYDYARDYNVLYVSPGTVGTIVHSGKFSSAVVTGSPAHDEYMKLQPQLLRGEPGVIPNYIKQNPNSPMAMVLLNSFHIGPILVPEAHEPLYDLLSPRNKATLVRHGFEAPD